MTIQTSGAGDSPAPRAAGAGVRSVPVKTSGGSYEVVAGAGLLAELGPRVRGVLPDPRAAFIVADSRVPRSTVESAASSLGTSGFRTTIRFVESSEEAKSFDAYERILIELARERHERGDPVVAVGGGVVGDLAGFAAATYRRGVPLVQCPTTLLAMVDAAIGGKTGVNLRTGPNPGDLKKNMVGAFHQPSLVICDASVLGSLPPGEFGSGLAECVKHGLLGGDYGHPDLLDFLAAQSKQILSLDQAALVELVARNAAIKAACVALDERESGSGEAGGRMALNMGHTVGHAIETIPTVAIEPGRSGLRHGHAVALGLIAEAACGEAVGATPRGLAAEIVGILAALGLPVRASGLPSAEQVRSLMLDDKKVAAGRIRLAVPVAGRRCRVLTDPPAAAIDRGLSLIRA